MIEDVIEEPVATLGPRRVVVFLGPSLPLGDAQAMLDATYLPPARRGDVYRVLSSGPEAIVLVDGMFHGSPSVWQRELLDAIDDGVRVIGAASMGALRAIELAPFGMVGCGRVFEWYRDGVIEGDDEVALHHGDADSGFALLSEPLVNIRATLADAVRHECITSQQAAELIDYAKALHYPERSYRRLLGSRVAREWAVDVVANLRDFLSTRRVDLKREDAESALRLCRRLLTGRTAACRRAEVPVSARTLWGPTRALEGIVPAGSGRSGAELVEMARRQPALFADLRRRATQRFFVREWASQKGLECPAEAEVAFRRRWERDHHIDLGANGLTTAAYDRLLRERALVYWVAGREPATTTSEAERRIVLRWAVDNGVDSQSSPAGEGLVEWVLDWGPSHFGLFWSEDLALLEELQMTGIAARLVARCSVQAVAT